MKHVTTIIRAFFLIGMLCVGSISQAQEEKGFIPPSIDDEDIPVTKTEIPVPEKGDDYIVKYFEGTTDGVEGRIAVKKIGYVTRPVFVQVFTEDDQPVKVEFVKKNWDDVVKEGRTKKGIYEASFKTALEFGIKISSQEKGVSYIVAVSAGKELYPPTKLFVDAATFRAPNSKNLGKADFENASASGQLGKNGNGGSNNILFILIAIALFGILGLLAVLVLKKKKGAAVIVFFICCSLYSEAGIIRALSNNTARDMIFEMGNNVATSVANHYGKGGFANSPYLGPDDSDFDPDMDPRGQPSLPSSCLDAIPSPSYENDGGNGRDGQDGRDGSNGNDGTPGDSGTDGANGSDGDNGIDGGNGTDGSNGNDDEDHKYDKIKPQFDQEDGTYDDTKKPGSTSDEEDNKYKDDNKYPKGDKPPNGGPDKDDGKYDDVKTPPLGSKDDNNKKNDDTAQAIKYQTQMIKAGFFQIGGRRNAQQSREEGCDCLENAYRDLQVTRSSLDKLLRIGQHTKKVVDHGISFGDSFSGIHAVSGLAWQVQRAEILETMVNFDNTYDNKYDELIESLYDRLVEIDRCEKMLGEEDWYSKAGFIYYEFMKVRYASYK